MRRVYDLVFTSRLRRGYDFAHARGGRWDCGFTRGAGPEPKSRHLWLSSAKRVPGDSLIKQFRQRLRHLSPCLYWITGVAKIIGTQVAVPPRGGPQDSQRGEPIAVERPSESVTGESRGQDTRMPEDSEDAGLRRRRGGNTQDPEGAEDSPAVAENSLPPPTDTVETDTGTDNNPPQRSPVRAAPLRSRRAQIVDSYAPVHEDTLIFVPRFQSVWKLAFSALNLVWIFLAFVRSLSHKYEAERELHIRNAARARAEQGVEDGMNRVNRGNGRGNRHRIEFADWGNEARHQRYTPGNNPQGEDLTLFLRQAMMGGM